MSHIRDGLRFQAIESRLDALEKQVYHDVYCDLGLPGRPKQPEPQTSCLKPGSTYRVVDGELFEVIDGVPPKQPEPEISPGQLLKVVDGLAYYQTPQGPFMVNLKRYQDLPQEDPTSDDKQPEPDEEEWKAVYNKAKEDERAEFGSFVKSDGMIATLAAINLSKRVVQERKRADEAEFERDEARKEVEALGKKHDLIIRNRDDIFAKSMRDVTIQRDQARVDVTKVELERDRYKAAFEELVMQCRKEMARAGLGGNPFYSFGTNLLDALEKRARGE